MSMDRGERYCVEHGEWHREEGMFACNGPCRSWSCVAPTLDPLKEWCDDCYENGPFLASHPKCHCGVPMVMDGNMHWGCVNEDCYENGPFLASHPKCHCGVPMVMDGNMHWGCVNEDCYENGPFLASHPKCHCGVPMVMDGNMHWGCVNEDCYDVSQPYTLAEIENREERRGLRATRATINGEARAKDEHSV